MTKDGALLETRALGKHFDGLSAVHGLDFAVAPGEIRGLIGPNGAGKTTVFNLVTGIYPPSEGEVLFEGAPLLDSVTMGMRRRRPPFEITRQGVARTFQNIRLFNGMTALENVIVGADSHHRHTVLDAILRTPRLRKEERDAQEVAENALHFVGIHAYANELAGNLSYGDQRRVEIARALATRPKLLLLDEPAAGMNPTEKARLMELIGKIRDQKITILLIEHDMKLVMSICDRVAVLDHGEKIADGAPKEVQRDPRVIEAYLGSGASEGANGQGTGKGTTTSAKNRSKVTDKTSHKVTKKGTEDESTHG